VFLTSILEPKNEKQLEMREIKMWPFETKKKSKEKVYRSNYVAVKETTEEIEIEKMANKFKEALSKTSNEVIFLCIGSDRSTGDSLGPLVGTMLKEKNIPFPVYGTLQNPVHALNIKKVLKDIQDTHKEPFILGIDACLGEENQIGFIFLKEGSFIPGNALNKVLPSVGDYHMKAIVNYLDPISPMQSLNNTRLYTVMKLAEIMTKIIIQGVDFDKTQIS
jgi:putative sporulation protein YyaC